LINYVKLTYKISHSYKRYKRYVKKHGLICQDCGGTGEYIEEYLPYSEWTVPYYKECGWCQGTGKVTKWIRGKWLRMKKEEKRSKICSQNHNKMRLPL
jgi:hypothetical protein